MADNSWDFQVSRQMKHPGSFSRNTFYYNDVLAAGDNANPGTEGQPRYPNLNPLLGEGSHNAVANDVHITDNAQYWRHASATLGRVDKTTNYKSWATNGESNNNLLGESGHPPTISIASWESHGGGVYGAGTLTVRNGFTHDGSGTLKIRALKSDAGATISNGTSHWIHEGTVENNLVVESGSTIELRGLTIKGDLIIRNSGTQVNAEGCHVQGSVQLETDIDTQQNFYGGSIIGEGYTNEIRDSNGNDRSASSNWNRVSGV